MNAWLFHSWRTLAPSPLILVPLTFAAILSGAIVGSEREKREKPAGMRTLIMVTLGAAVFTMISFAFTTTTGDSGRVAAQIVAGIGFLGAGVIMRGRGLVSGTTTAATIWMMAAIGMVVGAGYPLAAISLSVLVRMVLSGVYLWERHVRGTLPVVHVEIDFDPEQGKTRVHIERMLMEFGVYLESRVWTPMNRGNDLEKLTLELRLYSHHISELLDEIAELPAVQSIKK